MLLLTPCTPAARDPSPRPTPARQLDKIGLVLLLAMLASVFWFSDGFMLAKKLSALEVIRSCGAGVLIGAPLMLAPRWSVGWPGVGWL